MIHIKPNLFYRFRFFLKIFTAGYLIILLHALACPVMAQDLDMFIPEFFSLKKTIIGLGAGLAPEYEGADEFKAFAFPEFRYNLTNGCYAYLLGPAIRVNLIPSRTFAFGPMIRYRPGRNSVKDEVIDKFKKIDPAAESGAFGNLTINNFSFYAAMNKDITDTHNGYLIDIAAGYRSVIEYNVQLIIQAIGTYASDKFMETYFSVDAENSQQSGLPEYEAGAGLKDIGVMVALQYKINSNWGVLGIMKYTRLLGDAMESPIVEKRGDSNNFMDGIAINYIY